MEEKFYDLVDHELQQTLPALWKRIPGEKLLGEAPYKIRHAFISEISGKSKLVNILVLPSDLIPDLLAEEQLIKLRDYILSRNCLLMVINEEESEGYLGDMGIFISETLQAPGPNFIWISCARDRNHKTTVDWETYEDLNTVFTSVWDGKLSYRGPETGLQQVNLEVMKDECWKCRRHMKTVTGIVFPDRQLLSWDNAEWFYYNQLLQLSEINGQNADLIKQYIEALRINDPAITPVGLQYSHTVRHRYFAASCPDCDCLRGSFFVNDERTTFLHTLGSRLDGSLEYYSIRLHIDQLLIDTINDGFETCDHTCPTGWERR